MVDNHFRLMTAIEAEDELGQKYFYRQKTYRYQESGSLHAFKFRGRQCFLPHKLIQAYINDLKGKLESRFPELSGYQVLYDEGTRRVIIDGIFGRYVAVNADKENEEDLLTKLKNVLEWVADQGIEDELLPENLLTIQEETSVDETVAVEKVVTELTSDEIVGSPGNSFPADIKFIKIDTPVISGVEVKSYILISMPSVADFIGVRTDHFARWLQQSTFTDFVVSANPKQLHDPQYRGSWKKGFAQGHVTMLPLELIPEVLVAFRQSGYTPTYPARAEQLYLLAKSTLEAVGLAISGNKTKAAAELARVSEGLGIEAADQVIEIFKRYESRPFQIETTKKFAGKVKKENRDYGQITGDITLGVTGMYPNAWLAKGARLGLPYKQRTSGREVMRAIAPSDSVGITFSESHYLKDSSNMREVIETGKQGKSFYERLKSVGLLDGEEPPKIDK